MGKKGSLETYPCSKDGVSYNLADSGCREATVFLGFQSLCLECPFPECLLVKSEKSDRHWKKKGAGIKA